MARSPDLATRRTEGLQSPGSYSPPVPKWEFGHKRNSSQSLSRAAFHVDFRSAKSCAFAERKSTWMPGGRRPRPSNCNLALNRTKKTRGLLSQCDFTMAVVAISPSTPIQRTRWLSFHARLGVLPHDNSSAGDLSAAAHAFLYRKLKTMLHVSALFSTISQVFGEPHSLFSAQGVGEPCLLSSGANSGNDI